MIAAQLENGLSVPEGFATFAFAEAKPLPVTTYSEWFREEILPSRWLTYFVAFFVHWVAILAMAAIYLHIPGDFPPIMLNAVISDSEPQESSALEILPADAEVSVQEDPATAPDALELSASTWIPKPDEKLLDVMPDSLSALGINAAALESVGKVSAQPTQKVVVTKVPDNAVSAGSFSVWTEPDNPDPGEPYKIIVQIRLPDGTERYSVADLEGVVVGSDGYQKLIPGNLRGFLPVHEGQARLEVHIVSADENVLDTVFVRSKVLREAQKLQLRF